MFKGEYKGRQGGNFQVCIENTSQARIAVVSAQRSLTENVTTKQWRTASLGKEKWESASWLSWDALHRDSLRKTWKLETSGKVKQKKESPVLGYTIRDDTLKEVVKEKRVYQSFWKAINMADYGC